MSKRDKLELDWETADRITLASLKDMLKHIEKENRRIKKQMKSDEVAEYVKSDYASNAEHIIAFKKVIKYYGG